MQDWVLVRGGRRWCCRRWDGVWDLLVRGPRSPSAWRPGLWRERRPSRSWSESLDPGWTGPAGLLRCSAALLAVQWWTVRRGVKCTIVQCVGGWVGRGLARRFLLLAFWSRATLRAIFKDCDHGTNTCWDAVVYDCAVCALVGTTQRRPVAGVAEHSGCGSWWSPTSFGCSFGSYWDDAIAKVALAKPATPAQKAKTVVARGQQSWQPLTNVLVSSFSSPMSRMCRLVESLGSSSSTLSGRRTAWCGGSKCRLGCLCSSTWAEGRLQQPKAVGASGQQF